MKIIANSIIAAFSVIFTMAGSTSTARAADLTLDGSGFYELGNSEFFLRKGAGQSGRFRNLGRNFYQDAEIGISRITNNSSSRSGSMSFELWGKPFYSATSGIIMMTRGFSPLRGSFNYPNVETFGTALSLGQWRFPELNLYERSRRSWAWRDALTFSYSDYL